MVFLNLSLQDVAALSEIIEEHCTQDRLQNIRDIVSDYEDWRLKEQKNIMDMTDGIVAIFTHASSLVKFSRHFGLSALAYAPLLKNKVAKQACGLGGRVARLMRTPQ